MGHLSGYPFCRKARKDGTCKTLDGLTPLLAHPERVKFEHKPPAGVEGTDTE
jgi:hypothetical protein